MHPQKSRPKPVVKSKSESILVNDLLAAISRHKGLIVLGSILGVLLGFLYMNFMPSKFESKATILLLQNDSAAMAAEMSHRNASLSEDLLATHIGIIQSRSIVTKALNRPIDGKDTVEGESQSVSAPSVSDDPIDIDGMVSSLKAEASEAAGTLATHATVTDSAAIDTPVEPPAADALAIGTPVTETPANDLTKVAATSATTDGELSANTGQPFEPRTLRDLPSITTKLGEGESPVAYVLENLYAYRGGESGSGDSQLLTISFQHSDPEDARKVVAAIVEEYQEFIDSKFKDINVQAAGLINTARKELEQQIDDLSKEYQVFRNEAPLLASTSGGANIFASRYEDHAAELSTVLVKIDERISRIDIVKEGIKKLKGKGRALEKLALIDDQNAQRLGILVGVEGGEADSATFQALQPERVAGATTEYTQLLALRSKLNNAISERGPNHPEVKSLQSQLTDMEKFLESKSAGLAVEAEDVKINADTVMTAYIHMLENDLADLQRRQKDLEARMITAEEDAKRLVAFEIQDEGLVRKMARAEELYNSVVERLRDINMQTDSKPLINELIAEPLPGKLVAPTLPIAIAIGLLGMVFFAGSGVLIAELSDRSVHSAAELSELFGTDLVAHLPDFNATAENRKLLRIAKNNDSPVDASVLALHCPDSPTSESFKALRTQLLFALGGNQRVVAITSARQGDGKSTAIANLAVSIAQAGRRILLVDCDLRRPRQHTLFGFENGIGLTDVLNDNEEVQDCIHATPIAKLSVITCGAMPDNPAELLSGERFLRLLESLRESYDIVLLDCPPLMPVSDAAVIASVVDGVMVVTQVGPRSRVDASSCKKTLDSVGGKLLGLIVNRVEESFGGYMVGNYGFGNGTYEYRYGYGYGNYANGKVNRKANGTPVDKSTSDRVLGRN